MDGKHLTLKDRFYIEKRLAADASCYRIAKELEVHHSTVRREIQRNSDPSFKGLYSSRRAETLSQTRRATAYPGRALRQVTPNIQALILQKLSIHTSPDVISGELRTQQGISISKNTIYRYLLKDRRAGGGLYRLLPHHGKPYNRHGANSRPVSISGRIGIEQRPAIVDQKQQFGHFEIDTVFGKNQESFLLTAVDKASKITIIRKLPDKRAETVVAAFREIIGSTLYEFKTLTSDNGGEFARHEQIASLTGADFYFARPYHSWERGLNEHTNGLIRRFYPKGTDFNQVSDKEIAKLEHTLNTRGRKSLGYKSPNDVFLEHLMAA